MKEKHTMIQYPQMQTQQQATPNASAVNIQIFNPQAYGSTAAPSTSPIQQNLDNQIYSYPQNSVYAPGQANYGYVPVQTPAPQVMPQPILNDAPQPQETQVSQQPAQNDASLNVASENTAQTAPQAPQNTVDLNAINTGLQNNDLNAQTEAITKVAQLSQSTPDVALQVVDNQVMKSLIDIIQKDTTQLEGPNAQQIEIAEKSKEGKQLTPDEQKVLEQSSPREIAEKNKVFAMFTLAMLQKLQRDEIDNYNAQSPNNQVPAVKMEELPGFNEISNIIKTSDIPAVKVAGIQALSYVARPEDKATLEGVLSGLSADSDPTVQQAVQEALSHVTQPAPEVQQQA